MKMEILVHLLPVILDLVGKLDVKDDGKSEQVVEIRSVIRPVTNFKGYNEESLFEWSQHCGAYWPCQ